MATRVIINIANRIVKTNQFLLYALHFVSLCNKIQSVVGMMRAWLCNSYGLPSMYVHKVENGAHRYQSK